MIFLTTTTTSSLTQTIIVLFLSFISCKNIFATFGQYVRTASLVEIKCIHNYYRDSDYSRFKACIRKGQAHGQVTNDVIIPSVDLLEELRAPDLMFVELTDKLISAVKYRTPTDPINLDINYHIKTKISENGYDISDTDPRFLARVTAALTKKLNNFKCVCDYMIDSDLEKCKSCFLPFWKYSTQDLNDSITHRNMVNLFNYGVRCNNSKKKDNYVMVYVK